MRARTGGGDEDECAICLDALQQPQTLPCSHRFCRGCVSSMRQHGVAEAQVCPLCRGPMPDAEGLYLEAVGLLTRYQHASRRWKQGQRGDAPRRMRGLAPAPLPPAMQELLSKAEGLLREALAIDSGHAGAHDILGCVLGLRGDAAGSLSQHRRAIAADKQHAPAHNNLGDSLRARGDAAGAEAAYRAATIADPQLAHAHVNLSVHLRGRGDTAGAEAALRTAIAAPRQAATPVAHCYLGTILEARGDLAGAEAGFRAAIAADPQYADAHYNLGVVLKQRGDGAGAEAAIRIAADHDPQHAKAHGMLGNVLAQRGDVVNAEAAYRRAIAVDPQNATHRSNLGVLLSDRTAAFTLSNFGEGRSAPSHPAGPRRRAARGEAPAAGTEAAYRAAVAADPQDAVSHSNLGAVLAQRGDFVGADAAIRAALAANPRYAKAHYNLALLLRARGDNSGAARSFAAAAKHDPSHANAKEGLREVLEDLKLEGRKPSTVRAPSRSAAGAPAPSGGGDAQSGGGGGGAGSEEIVACAMSETELKTFLDAQGVDHSTCREKSELIALAMEQRYYHTTNLALAGMNAMLTGAPQPSRAAAAAALRHW